MGEEVHELIKNVQIGSLSEKFKPKALIPPEYFMFLLLSFLHFLLRGARQIFQKLSAPILQERSGLIRVRISG